MLDISRNSCMNCCSLLLLFKSCVIIFVGQIVCWRNVIRTHVCFLFLFINAPSISLHQQHCCAFSFLFVNLLGISGPVMDLS